VEAGAYDVIHNGVRVKFEAVSYVARNRYGRFAATASLRAYEGDPRTYLQRYTAPVVLGQVMTYNAAVHTVFFARGNAVTATPSTAVLRVGMHVGESRTVLGLESLRETLGCVLLSLAVLLT
jgi:hypothetical protein